MHILYEYIIVGRDELHGLKEGCTNTEGAQHHTYDPLAKSLMYILMRVGTCMYLFTCVCIYIHLVCCLAHGETPADIHVRHKWNFVV